MKSRDRDRDGELTGGGALSLARHLYKSCPNSCSETIVVTKKGILFVLILLFSMDWNSTHVFQPKDVGSPWLSGI